MQGPDHKSSLEPSEFKSMVEAIRNIEKALGNKTKKPSSLELKNRLIVRKSIVAARDIKKGEVFSEENLTVKRPGTGLNAMLWNRIIGKPASQDFEKDGMIKS